MTSTAISETVSELRADNPDGPDVDEYRYPGTQRLVFAPDLSPPEIKADGSADTRSWRANLSEMEATAARIPSLTMKLGEPLPTIPPTTT